MIGSIIFIVAIVLMAVFGVRLAKSLLNLQKPAGGPRGFTVMTPSRPNEEEDVEIEWMKEK